jgi:Ca2+-transporting ATPase
MHWHKLNIPETFELLGTKQQGLSTIESEEKLLQYGPNELQEGKKKSIGLMLLAQFKDVMILILLAAAVIAGIVGDSLPQWYDTGEQLDTGTYGMKLYRKR